MSKPWTHLLYRYGNEVGSPTMEQIQVAARELFHENIPGISEGDYDEHGAASLRYGFDEGPMYELEITRSGFARWQEWADQDYTQELSPMKELSARTEQQAIELWMALSRGNIELVRAAFEDAA